MKLRVQLVTLLLTAALAACDGGDDDGQDAAPDAALGVDGGDGSSDADTTDATPIDAGPPDASPDASVDAGPVVPEDCTNTTDDDADGLSDCADPDCAGAFTCQAPACPAGQTRAFFRANDLPRIFEAETTVSSTIAVPTVGAVTDAAVKVSLAHGYVADIEIRLVSPENTTLDLSSNNGSNGDHYKFTVLTDAAASSIQNAAAPFTGSFRPEQPFTTLDGQTALGNWRLDVEETYFDGTPATDQGAFAAFELMLCVCTDCEIGPACNDDIDNDGDELIDCADADCSGNIRCMPETACTDGLDNDLDTLVDCLDDQCVGISGCEFGTETLCADGLDNDADGRKDCFDADCTGGATCGAAESNCTDGMDNDGDGPIDCADPGCQSNPACQQAESSCFDGFDNDGDGLLDCADPSCAGGPCEVPPCPAGQSELVVASTNVPVAIPDNSTTGVTSTIDIAQTGTVKRVIVTFSATHTFDGDLDISLLAPGVVAPGLDLCSDNGSLDDNFTNTVFSDSAATPIIDGTAPFTGAFRPEVMLSTLNDTPLAGAWRLLAVDDAGSDLGTLTRFDLYICYTP